MVLQLRILGWGGLFAVMLMRRFGRLPVLFWSQVFAVGWLVGCTFAPNIRVFTGTLSYPWVLVGHILKLCLPQRLDVWTVSLRVSGSFVLPMTSLIPSLLLRTCPQVTVCHLTDCRIAPFTHMLCRVSMSLQTCSRSTCKPGRYTVFSMLSYDFFLISFWYPTAEYLDYGVHPVTFPFAIRFWIFGRTNDVCLIQLFTPFFSL